MENASKALIIAGAILIAILLITVGILLINSGSGVAETGVTTLSSQEIQIYNSKFEAYVGKRSGSEIKKLISVASTNNATGEPHVDVVGLGVKENEISISKTYNVVCYYSDGLGQKANSVAAQELGLPIDRGVYGVFALSKSGWKPNGNYQKGCIQYVYFYE